jgi:hypothetical protein
MPEDSNSGLEQSRSASHGVPGMTFLEKFAFLAIPVCLALCGLGNLAATAFGLVKVTAALLHHFHQDLRHPHQFKVVLEALLVILAYAIAISGALLVYPAMVLRSMLRRRRETGSLLPQGEELLERRWKRKNPSWWMRLLVPGFFALIATGWTYGTITERHRLALVVWSFPALMWVVAIIAAIDCYYPRRDRLWTGVCVSGAFGSLAAAYLVAAPHALRWQIEYWIFPVLTASIAIFAAVSVIRSWRRARAAALAASAGPQ